MEPNKCAYCGRDDCRRCVAELAMQVRQVLDDLEQMMLVPDARDEIGVNNHLRAAWGARDRINELLAG